MAGDADLSAVVARVREQLASEASERTYIELSKPSAQALTDAASECECIKAIGVAGAAEIERQRAIINQNAEDWAGLSAERERLRVECERLRGELARVTQLADEFKRSTTAKEAKVARVISERDKARAELNLQRELEQINRWWFVYNRAANYPKELTDEPRAKIARMEAILIELNRLRAGGE